MGEEFGGGVCGGNWYWNSSINLFSSSPCSSTINGDTAGNNIPSSIDWINQELFHDNGRLEENYSQLLQQQARLDYCSNGSKNFCEDSNSIFINNNNDNSILKQVNDHQAAGLSTMNSDNSYSLYTSSLLQTLFDTDSESLLVHEHENQDQIINYDQFLQPSNNLPKASPMSTKQHDQLITNNIVHDQPMRFVSSTKSQLSLPSSINYNNSTNRGRPTNLTRKVVPHDNEEARDSAASEPAIKRPRIETPSPLPTFKVRKEKLGDRITALQQLVSPFGKTDTASVLQEAIEYIKFLHDQATALSSPYFKNGPHPLMKRQQASDKIKELEGLKKDLKSRGLCLMPISSTFPVASETTSDFWTPTFGGTFN